MVSGLRQLIGPSRLMFGLQAQALALEGLEA